MIFTIYETTFDKGGLTDFVDPIPFDLIHANAHDILPPQSRYEIRVSSANDYCRQRIMGWYTLKNRELIDEGATEKKPVFNPVWGGTSYGIFST